MTSVSAIKLPERFNLATYLLHRHTVEGRAGRRALICPDRDWSYGQLAEAVHRFAAGLTKLGAKPAERVLLLLPDGAEMVIAYLGTIHSGSVAVPTNTALRADDYAYFLDESEAAVLVTHESLWTEVEPALGNRRPHLRHVIVCGQAPEGTLAWDDWLSAQPAESEPAPSGPDDIAFWLWTSGSTGAPKAALHRQRDWVYCCRHYAAGILGIGPEDRCFSSSKLFHAYGLGNSLAFPLAAGAEVVLDPARPTPAGVLQQAVASRPTIFFSVPTLYGLMLHHMDKGHDYDLSSIRLAVSAAEPLPGSVLQGWMKRFDCEILDGIGSTEALHIYASSTPGRARPDTTGFPVPGYQLRITDERNRPVAAGEVGDLWVSGGSVSPGYWNRPELSRDRMRDGWFLSGDKYWQDRDGYLHYAGRSDDMFRVSGQWVSPIEVESALTAHEAVLECAVVPWEVDGLTKPKAFVIPAGNRADQQLVAELQEWVKSRITPYKYPREIEFVSRLPKTAAGKIQRFKLRS